MNPKVSICIPAYKQTELLRNCLESVLMQDYQDYELIITDDSPDDSVELVVGEILDGRSYTYTRNTPALGSPENWNAAVSKARGEYIKILHHDDFFTETGSLKKFVDLLDENPDAALGFCSTVVLNMLTMNSRIHSPAKKDLERLKRDPQFLFFANTIGAPSAVIYRSEYDIQFDKNLKWLVDVDFYIRILNSARDFAFIEEPLICTSDGAEGQVTQSVYNDETVQIREHVLLFGKLQESMIYQSSFIDFFDDLFIRFGLSSYKELTAISDVPPGVQDFFYKVFSQLHSNRWLKRLKKRFYTSRYNKKFFKLSRY